MGGSESETTSKTSSDSSTNSDSFTNTASKQKSITTNICNEGSESSSNSNGQESNRDQSNERNTGTTFDKSFEIPGDSRSVSNSKAVSETDEFFQEFSGSISHTEASCVKYSASLNDNSPPAFSSDFKDIIREMDALTEELWDSNIETKKLNNGKLISRKNEKNEKKFDALFSKFIENFGTHYIQKAVMGGMQRISNKIKSLKEDTGNKEQVENCLNKAIKENRVKSALETREEDLQTYGGGAGEDIYQWTTNNFPSPCLTTSWRKMPSSASGALPGWITPGELVNLTQAQNSNFINSGRKRRKRRINPRLAIQGSAFFINTLLNYISHFVFSIIN